MTAIDAGDAAILVAAETIDRLTNLDFPRRGAIAALHEEARRLVGEPLGLAAAREALARTPDGAVIAILTGFPEFPWIRRGVAETDGPVGAAVLARSFIKARQAIPILPCEPHFAPVIEAAVRGIGLTPIAGAGLDTKSVHPGDPVCLIEATSDPIDAHRWLAARAPALVIAIERPGRASTGVYHSMSGRDVSHCLNNFEDLFLGAAAAGTWTIGIGDGGIAAESVAASLVTAVVANFGATAIAAAMALLTGRFDVLPTASLELRALEASVAAGGVDGQHNECVASIDGLAAPVYGAVLTLITDAVDRVLRERSAS